ncbi:alpha/beta hydrolase [Microbacterium sp. LS_15]|uniref:alpha/beta fold hydrolase n=1 Tax=Microbacterium sp. LS_15 TaxID=3055790 RepID=UPI0035C23EFD
MSIYPGAVRLTVRHDGVDAVVHDGGVENGPPIVLLHGTGGRVETHFFTVYPMLASRHRVIGIDLPAASSTGEALSVEELAAHVWAVIEERARGQRVALVGYSLGSSVAAVAAATRPADVDSLVLLNGWVQTDNALRLRFELWQQLYSRGLRDELARFMLMSVYSRSYLDSIPYVGPRPWAQVEQMLDDYSVGPGSEQQVRVNAAMDLTRVLPRITARTLVIGSIDDQYIPFVHSKELFGAISAASLAAIGGGHGSVTERPAEVFHLVDRFVRDPAAYPAGSIVGDDSVLQLAALRQEQSA